MLGVISESYIFWRWAAWCDFRHVSQEHNYIAWYKFRIIYLWSCLVLYVWFQDRLSRYSKCLRADSGLLQLRTWKTVGWPLVRQAFGTGEGGHKQHNTNKPSVTRADSTICNVIRYIYIYTYIYIWFQDLGAIHIYIYISVSQESWIYIYIYVYIYMFIYI